MRILNFENEKEGERKKYGRELNTKSKSKLWGLDQTGDLEMNTGSLCGCNILILVRQITNYYSCSIESALWHE